MPYQCAFVFQDLHVISTDENRVVAAVQEWNQNETYNLYVSDTSGVYYTLALENVVSSMGPEGNVMVDLYEVTNINVVIWNKNNKSVLQVTTSACSAGSWGSLTLGWIGMLCMSPIFTLQVCSINFGQFLLFK